MMDAALSGVTLMDELNAATQQESSTTSAASKSHARFEVKAAGWDDKPTVRGITEKIKTWITTQVGRFGSRMAPKT